MAGDLQDLARYAGMIEHEVERLERVLHVADEMQWQAAPPAGEADEETRDRKATRGPADPTGDTVADPKRLDVRHQVVKSEAVLKHTLISVIAVRRGLERAMDAWEGDARV